MWNDFKMLKIGLFCARENGHAGVVLNIIKEHNLFEIVGFFDDNVPAGSKVMGIPVLGKISDFPNNLPRGVTHFHVCTGNNNLRQNCYDLIKKNNFKLINVIHPSAIISEEVILGEGIFIGPNVVIVNSSKIGDNVLINTAATIDHNNILENHVFVGPGCHTSGRVHLKENCFLGAGAIVIPDVIVGSNSIVGAGAVVISDVPDNITVVGVPAKKLKVNE